MNIIELNHVTKTFGSRVVINDLSMQVAEREFVALVGPSGCGKSTILNMIGLLETIDQGEIKIKQQTLPNINSRAATKIRRNHINYLFQSYALVSEITVTQNLMLAMAYDKQTSQEKQHKIHYVLALLNIAHLANDKVNTLSGGEQQRVAIARTIVKPGDIILADEPTGALDEELANISFNLIQSLRDDYGKTIVLVTHNMEQAQSADRLIQLGNA